MGVIQEAQAFWPEDEARALADYGLFIFEDEGSKVSNMPISCWT